MPGRSFIALFLACFTVSLVTHAQTHTLSKTETKILERVLNLTEVIRRSHYVDSASGHKRHLSAVIYTRPTLRQHYYWVKVWEDNGSNFVSHLNFFIDSATLTIRYFDTANDTAVDLDTWRKQHK